MAKHTGRARSSGNMDIGGQGPYRWRNGPGRSVIFGATGLLATKSINAGAKLEIVRKILSRPLRCSTIFSGGMSA